VAITAKWFGNSVTGQYSATAARRVDWVSDTIKVALTTATYVPNQDTHVFFSDVTNEITGTGYTAGGVALGTKSVTYDTATNETRLIAANSQWTTATFTTAIAVVYKDTGTGTTSPLLGWVDFGGNETVTTGTFTIQWDATGVLKIAAA
jgi:hypothetical protein